MVQHVRELWAVVTDRRHAADNVAKRAALKEEWLKLSRVLANMRNRRGKMMPGWVTLQLKLIYTIKSQLGQWRKLRRMQVATGGQRGITSHFSRAPTRATRSATTPDGGSAAAATAVTSPAATAAGQTPTATTVSQLQRQQAPERTTEQQSKRHRQCDDDDPDGATSESPTPTDTDPACADHDASTASAALPRVATAAPQATTTATVGSSKRQMTMAEFFQRTTRRRADDPGAAARPLPDAPPLVPMTTADHPDPSLHLSPRLLRRSDRTDHRPQDPTRRSSALTSPERTRKCTTTDRTPQRRRRTKQQEQPCSRE